MLHLRGLRRAALRLGPFRRRRRGSGADAGGKGGSDGGGRGGLAVRGAGGAAGVLGGTTPGAGVGNGDQRMIDGRRLDSGSVLRRVMG